LNSIFKQIIVLLLFASFLQGQSQDVNPNACFIDESCNPDPNSGGYCPFPPPDFIVNEYNSLNLTARAPRLGEGLPITYIIIRAIEGLPKGITWTKSSEKFYPNQLACLNLEGIPVQVGSYNLTIYITAHILGLDIQTTDNWLVINVIKSKNPEVDFIADTLCAKIGEAVQFYNQTDSSATSFFWEFEKDNDSSVVLTDANPQFTWTQAGYYSVALKACNSFGCKKIQKYNYIQILNENGQEPLEAVCSVSKQTPLVFEKIQFYDECEEDVKWISQEDNTIHFLACRKNSVDPQAWYWTFEHGIPPYSFEKDPVVYWEQPGNYTVSLSVNEGSDRILIDDFIRVKNLDAVHLYPNPSNGIFTVEALQMKALSIYDMRGVKILYFDNLEPALQVLNVTSLQSGIYLLQIHFLDGHHEVRKMVISK
jgi:PKD repeat protein